MSDFKLSLRCPKCSHTLDRMMRWLVDVTITCGACGATVLSGKPIPIDFHTYRGSFESSLTDYDRDLLKIVAKIKP